MLIIITLSLRIDFHFEALHINALSTRRIIVYVIAAQSLKHRMAAVVHLVSSRSESPWAFARVYIKGERNRLSICILVPPLEVEYRTIRAGSKANKLEKKRAKSSFCLFKQTLISNAIVTISFDLSA